MRKFFKIGKLKAMVSAGASRTGHLFAYVGVKTRKGFHGGASIGTKGRQLYGGYSKGHSTIKFKHNLVSKRTRLRLR